MEKKQARNEIDLQYCWDVTFIFKDENAFKIELDQVVKELNKIENWKGKLLLSPETLYEFLEWKEAIQLRVHRLYVYAKLLHDIDMSNGQALERKGQAEQLETQFDVLTDFVVPELLSSNWNHFCEWMDSFPPLKKYHRYLTKIVRQKEHILGEKEEQILSVCSNIFKGSSETASTLCNVDLTFEKVALEDGSLTPLTNSSYGTLISHFNREVRKDAFQKLYGGYASVKNTLARTLNDTVMVHNVCAKLGGYPSARACSLEKNHIDEVIYDCLVQTVNEALPILYQYYALRKRVLQLEELHLYDVYAPLVVQEEQTYPFEEAKQLILESFQVFGKDYVQKLETIFQKRWIDVYPSAHKRSGAESNFMYDTPPYILLNYEDTFSDVLSLAHELGHSMHSWYASEKQEGSLRQYSIFIAEVASTVNELLLLQVMLQKTTDRKAKLNLLNQLLERFRGTLYRQTMFAEFEHMIHVENQSGRTLTAPYLSELYYTLNQKYFGPDVVIDSPIRYEWERIPHFYYNYYVYQYATGFSAACHIVKRILNQEAHALEDYFAFLSLGDAVDPVEALKVAGVDCTKQEVVESAVQLFQETIVQFEQLYDTIEK